MSFIKKVEDKLKLYQESPSDFKKYQGQGLYFIQSEIDKKLKELEKSIKQYSFMEKMIHELIPAYLATIIFIASFSSEKKAIFESCFDKINESLTKNNTKVSELLKKDKDDYIRILESFSFKFGATVVTQQSSVIDINKYPEKKSIKPTEEIICKDPKGNTLELIYDLIAFNVIEMNPSHYQEIAGILNKKSDNLKKDDIQKFNEIISQIKVNPREGIIRLTGQLLATPGLSNDYFMLKTIDLLLHHSISLEISESKNMMDFMSDYQKGYLKKKDLRILTNSSGSFSESRSLFWLKFIIEKDWVDYKDISSMIKRLSKILKDNTVLNRSSSSTSLHFSYNSANESSLPSAQREEMPFPFKTTKKF